MDRFWRFNSYLKTVFRERHLRRKSSVRTVTLSAAEREQRNGEIAFTMVRVGAGGIVIPHGLSQLLGGTQSIAAAALARNGFEPSSDYFFHHFAGIGRGHMRGNRPLYAGFCGCPRDGNVVGGKCDLV